MTEPTEPTHHRMFRKPFARHQCNSPPPSVLDSEYIRSRHEYRHSCPLSTMPLFDSWHSYWRYAKMRQWWYRRRRRPLWRTPTAPFAAGVVSVAAVSHWDADPPRPSRCDAAPIPSRPRVVPRVPRGSPWSATPATTHPPHHCYALRPTPRDGSAFSLTTARMEVARRPQSIEPPPAFSLNGTREWCHAGNEQDKISSSMLDTITQDNS